MGPELDLRGSDFNASNERTYPSIVIVILSKDESCAITRFCVASSGGVV